MLTAAAGLLIIVLAVFLLHGIKNTGPKRRAILIVLDAARADRFSTYGYGRNTTPNMDRLARNGVVFLNHFTQATHTRTEIPRLFNSRYFFIDLFPNHPSIPVREPDQLFLKPDPQSLSLPRALSAAGLRTCLVTAHFWMQTGTPFVRDFDEAYNLYQMTGSIPQTDLTVQTAIQWLEDHQQDDFFLYLHLMETHIPRRLGKNAKRFLTRSGYSLERPAGFTSDDLPENPTRTLNEAQRNYMDALYDGSLRDADDHLRELFQFLEESGTLKDTLIVITSDHGEYLLETEGRFLHGMNWYDIVAKVPLIISYPRKLSAASVKDFSESVDVMPTMLALLNIPLPPSKTMDGVDLVKDLRDRKQGRHFVTAEDGIRDTQYKCIFETPSQELFQQDQALIRGELYDLRTDPMETQNVWQAHPDVVSQMISEYKARMQPLYSRYKSATTDDPPLGAFAIGANAFSLNWKTPAELSAAGWQKDTDSSHFHIFSSGNAQPITIEFHIPNGTYRVEAGALGEAQITMNGSPAPVMIHTQREPAGQTPPLNEEIVPIGLVKIRDRIFHADIRCQKQRAFLLSHFGFTALESESSGTSREQDDETLRSLGYVN